MGEGLNWLAVPAHSALVRHSALSMGRGRQRAEELYSECVDRADQVHSTFREDGGASLTTHMHTGLKWYMYKHATKLGLQQSRTEALDRGLVCEVEHGDLEASDSVQYLRSQLDTFDQLILWMRVNCEMTNEAIGHAFWVSKNTARKWVQQALERAREILDTDV